MAAVARHKKAMNQHLATGLSSGLCGALTTWATWMGEVASTITNGFIFQALVSVLCMFCVSLTSYRFGHFLAGCGMEEEPKCFDEYCGLRILFTKQEKNIEMVEDGDTGSDSDRENGTEHEWGLHVDQPESWKDHNHTEVFLSDAVHLAISGLALIYIATFLGIAGGHKYYTGLLDMSMAPFGALLRWWLSLFNKYTAPFPFFTLVANTLGCLCNALAGVYEERMTDALAISALGALSTGFAGSLSTVSTFISELRSDTLGGLRLRFAYFFASFVAAMTVLIPIDYTMSAWSAWQAVTEACVLTDDEFLQRARQQEVLDGSTLILGIIYPEDAQSFYEAPRVIKGGQFDLQDSRSGSNGVRAPGSCRILIANVGDSRAVLCRAAQGEEARLHAFRLSEDHKPIVPTEQKRIEAIRSVACVHPWASEFWRQAHCSMGFGSVQSLWGYSA
eukprot:symbB.v1.2.005128.t1/scaffold226.1/size261315/7